MSTIVYQSTAYSSGNVFTYIFKRAHVGARGSPSVKSTWCSCREVTLAPASISGAPNQLQLQDTHHHPPLNPTDSVPMDTHPHWCTNTLEAPGSPSAGTWIGSPKGIFPIPCNEYNNLFQDSGGQMLKTWRNQEQKNTLHTKAQDLVSGSE